MDEKTEKAAESESPEILESELDEYDLLGLSEEQKEEKSPSAPLPDTNLAVTAQAFHKRMEKKKQEQQKVLSEEEKRANQRHAFMIKALMNIRRSLRDVTRIDLGDRFRFSMLKDDWQGWPRITINIRDALRPEAEYPSLKVTAHDRKALGVIEIAYHPDAKAEHISLASENEAQRMPSVLKNCVRKYLDLAGDIVLDAERQKDFSEDREQLGGKGIQEFEQSRDKEPTHEISGDLFEDDYSEKDALDALPSLDAVDALPDTVPADSADKRKG